MRISVILSAATLALLSGISRADVPPPPDTYTGPTTAHIAGLTFERQDVQAQGYWHYLGATLHDNNPLDYNGRWVFLTDCDAPSTNCRLAKAAGAVGGAIQKVDATDISSSDGDLGAFEKMLAAAKTGKVTLTLLLAGAGSAPRPLKTVTLTISTR